MPTWFLLSILASVFWALSMVFYKKGYESLSPFWTSIVSNFVGFLVQVPIVWFLAKKNFNSLNIQTAFFLILATGFYLLYAYTMNQGKVSLMAPLISISPLFTILFSYLILGESLSGFQGLAAGLILLGIFLLAAPDKRSIDFEKAGLGWLVWGLGYAFAAGLGDTLVKKSGQEIGSYSAVYWMAWLYLAWSPILFVLDKKGRKLPSFEFKKFIPTTLGSILIALGSMVYYIAFDYGPASLVSPLASTYPVITAFLGIVFLKEKVKLKQWLGIFLVISATMFLGYFS